MIERARAWVDTARHAPSGDNSQPWEVALAAAGGGLTLTLGLNEATRARPVLFDCAHVASYLSLGAFARNFTLLAAAEGCTLTGLREDAGRFTLTFAPGPARPDAPDPAATADLIRRRTTNRRPFRKDPLDDDTRQALERLARADGLVLREFTGAAKSQLAGVFFELDVVRYRNARLYREFLAELHFGAEAAASPDGLRDTTLGTPAPALLFLRLLRALIDEDPARARQSVTQLANLLRYSLQSGQLETVPFEDELELKNDRRSTPESCSSIGAATVRASASKSHGAFASAAQLAAWWGPDGFTNTIHEFDFRPGGHWRLTMHGPDGANYANESVFTEIAPGARIIFKHLEPVHGFEMTITFATHADGTALTWRMLFDDPEEGAKLRDFIASANEQIAGLRSRALAALAPRG